MTAEMRRELKLKVSEAKRKRMRRVDKVERSLEAQLSSGQRRWLAPQRSPDPAWRPAEETFAPLVAVVNGRNLVVTSPELRTLVDLVEGYKDREIAERQHVSVETVRTHVKALIRKWGARGRVHVAVLAVREGIVE